jgi:hypothetical protein
MIILFAVTLLCIALSGVNCIRGIYEKDIVGFSDGTIYIRTIFGKNLFLERWFACCHCTIDRRQRSLFVCKHSEEY